MPTYLIFRRETGEILQRYREVSLNGEALQIEPAEIIKLYWRPFPDQEDIRLDQLDIIDVDQEILQRGLISNRILYVDVERRALAEREVQPEGPSDPHRNT